MSSFRSFQHLAKKKFQSIYYRGCILFLVQKYLMSLSKRKQYVNIYRTMPDRRFGLVSERESEKEVRAVLGQPECFTCQFEYWWDTTHFKNTYSPITLGDISFINLVFIFRCSSSPRQPVYTRRVDFSVLVFSTTSIHYLALGLWLEKVPTRSSWWPHLYLYHPLGCQEGSRLVGWSNLWPFHTTHKVKT